MSNHDIKKETKERRLFELAFSLAEKNSGETYRILHYLHGKYIYRDKNDCPDIVYECLKGKKHPHRVIVGIEHFRVDQLSSQKSTKRTSNGAEISSHLNKIYKAGHSELEQESIVSEETKDQLLNQLSEYIKEESRKTYAELIADFSYNVDNHIRNVDEYKKNLNHISQGDKTELAFFVEFHAHFNTIFLNYQNKATKNEIGKLVFFNEITDEIQKAFNHGIDYFIILYDGYGYGQFSDVVAIHNGKIDNQLKRQNHFIYKYVGSDIVNNNVFSNVKVTWAKNNCNNYNITTTIEKTDEWEALNNLSTALNVAYHCQKHNIPFATTKDIHCIWEAIAPYLDRFEEKNGVLQPIFKNGYNQKIIEAIASSSLDKNP